MEITMENVFGVVVLLFDIWAIINVLSSNSSGLSKAGWTIGILILPVIGFVVWYLAGPKSSERITA